LNKATTKLVDQKTFQLLAATKEILSEITFNEENILVRYKADIDMENIRALDLDINKVYNKSNSIMGVSKEDNEDFNNVSVVISSMITSYARVYMAKLKLDILKYYLSYSSVPNQVRDSSFTIKLRLLN
jgi:hypothetical protein